mmetsp:Transcript_43495/g.92471  ORF Transcript_43495/g.92471 Transcript_43495/m.92471 type:complete len:201 (-) Transcript_43495:206-808(-)
MIAPMASQKTSRNGIGVQAAMTSASSTAPASVLNNAFPSFTLCPSRLIATASYSAACSSAPVATSPAFAAFSKSAIDLSSSNSAAARSDSACTCSCSDRSCISSALARKASDSSASCAAFSYSASACSRYSSPRAILAAARANSPSAAVSSSTDSDCNSRPASASVADFVCNSFALKNSASARRVSDADSAASLFIWVRW